MWPFNKTKYYKTKYEIVYYSSRYNATITVPKGYETDGSTGAIDIHSESWKVHDWICGNYSGFGPKPAGCRFDNGKAVTNKMASQILSDILKEEGRWIRAQYWYTFTFLFGGSKCKKQNGWW